MIINLWSTPRTGSIWYSHWLKFNHPGSMLITEMFNKLHMNMYHVQDSKGTILNFHHVVPGGFFKEYHLDDNNYLTVRRNYGTRSRSPDQEEQYHWELIKQVNPTQVLIVHNHVEPMAIDIKQYLLNSADKNIWICRRDRVAQLASYAVAISTRKFAEFIGTGPQDLVQDCDEFYLTNLLKRIQVWDQSPKNHSDIVEFEQINFQNLPGFPVDQNIDPTKRLSRRLLNIITQMVRDYENTKNQ